MSTVKHRLTETNKAVCFKGEPLMMNLDEMKEVNGGYGPKDFLSDLMCCLVLGPVGEGIVVAKHIVGAYH